MFPNRSILVASDLTERCEPALRAASDLCELSGASLHVIHAFELHTNAYVKRADARTAFQALLQEAREGLAEQLRRTVSPGVQVRSIQTELYLPWKAIVERAKTVAAELIVLGPHCHIPGDRFLGSTADRVVRYSDVPSLMVRRGQGLNARRIVLAVDGTRAAAAGWTEAVAWADALDEQSKTSELHIIISASDWTDRWAGSELIAGAIHDAREYLTSRRISIVGEVLKGDDAALDIACYLDRVDADLLVVATSGHTAFDRLISGSVTAELGSKISCAMLMVPVKDVAQIDAAGLLHWHMPMASV